jgi:hypothetical protein
MPQTEEEPQERTDEPIELPLGRNILVKHSGHNEYSQALRDGLRDWEKILVTSPTMIESYLVACLNTYEVIAYSGRGRAQLAQRRGKALGSALGIYLDYK